MHGWVGHHSRREPTREMRNPARDWCSAIIVLQADIVPTQSTPFAQFGTGFVFVTAFAELERLDVDCLRPITQLMDRSLASGILKAIPLIPDPRRDIDMNLLPLIPDRGKVRSVNGATREEAEREFAANFTP